MHLDQRWSVLRPVDNFVSNVAKDEVLAAFDPQLINTGSKLILIESGNGAAMFEPSKGRVGRTLQNLAAAGVDPKSIDIVLMSHLHPTIPTASAPPTARWHSPMRRSWCPRMTGNSG